MIFIIPYTILRGNEFLSLGSKKLENVIRTSNFHIKIHKYFPQHLFDYFEGIECVGIFSIIFMIPPASYRATIEGRDGKDDLMLLKYDEVEQSLLI